MSIVSPLASFTIAFFRLGRLPVNRPALMNVVFVFPRMIEVLTSFTVTLKSFSTASLICFLFALGSTSNTNLLLASFRAVLRSEEHRGPALEGALEALDLARWDELPEAQLPWSEIEAEASKQGVSEADVIWDRSGRHEEPAVPPIATKSRVKRKGKQAA